MDNGQHRCRGGSCGKGADHQGDIKKFALGGSIRKQRAKNQQQTAGRDKGRQRFTEIDH